MCWDQNGLYGKREVRTRTRKCDMTEKTMHGIGGNWGIANKKPAVSLIMGVRFSRVADEHGVLKH
jgi:hypothetical protein